MAMLVTYIKFGHDGVESAIETENRSVWSSRISTDEIIAGGAFTAVLHVAEPLTFLSPLTLVLFWSSCRSQTMWTRSVKKINGIDLCGGLNPAAAAAAVSGLLTFRRGAHNRARARVDL